LALLAILAGPAAAQEAADSVSAEDAAAQAEAPGGDAPEAPADTLLTAAELETLLAPVALYPDTLLVQLLVAATYPLQIVKADQAAEDHADLEGDARQEAMAKEGFDPSVEVLAVAFPEVLDRMASHIDWTETVGDAMLAQSDDVMRAVQVLRQQAVETGALIDTPEQEVTVEETLSTMGDPVETVIIQPTSPEKVYVPQYDTAAVYDTTTYGGSNSGDLWAAGLMGFATFALIDAIFDDDDDWNDYWGCRNCGGWNGGPIVRDPDIDIDVDGNVNIGNRVDIDRDTIKTTIDQNDINIDRNDIDIGDRNRLDGGWTPDPARQQEARGKLADRKGAGTPTTLPARVPDQGDDLRRKLSERTGTEDISRPGNAEGLRDAAVAAGAAGAVGGAIAGRDALKRSGDRKDIPVKRPDGGRDINAAKAAAAKVDRPAQRPAAAKAAAAKPAAKAAAARPAAKPAARAAADKAKVAQKPKIQSKAGGNKKAAIKKTSGGKKARKASSRGHSGKLKGRR
jgi:hypothetical protein